MTSEIGREAHKISREIARRADEAMARLMAGSSNVPTAESEVLTMEKLQRMIASMPPKETWLSTRLFPGGAAMVVEGAGERFTVAHPMFWARLHHELRDHPAVKPAATANPLLGFNITPTEIDPYEGDSEETAKWRAAHWDRLREAVEVAMQPLPDWLRSPPKFGRHG